MAKDQQSENREPITHSSRETREGTEGFTGGGNVGSRPEFAGRENVTEQRQDMALDPDQSGSERTGRNS